MSILNKMWGSKSKKDSVRTPQEVIQHLREMERLLETKQQYLETKIESELKTVKINGLKNKRLAIQALKRKKRLEKQLQQIDGTLATIELQREALENVSTNTTVLKTMKMAADVLKSAHQSLDSDKVHDLMDEIAEQQEMINEVTDAISNPTAFNTNSIDEEELEKELEELYQTELDEMLVLPGPAGVAAGSDGKAAGSAGLTVDLPSVPTENLKGKSQDDKELEKLLEWSQ